MLTVFSFNIWSSESFTHDLFAKSPFDTLELMTNIMMPLSGVLIALFVGWSLGGDIVKKQMATSFTWFSVWQILLRYIAPTAVTFVFLRTLMAGEEAYVIPALGAVAIVAGFALMNKAKK